ncbi:MAG TPA: hypothetical protein VMW75_01685 [Thermoanaerobaculia bacterium]|nr:hypothetical protein [Thermoanaerobaculia bacterium]
MAGPPLAVSLLAGALVTIDATTLARNTIAFQFNPSTLRRTLQPDLVGGGEQGDRSQAVRFTGAPVETLAFDAVFDSLASNSTSAGPGIYPQLAALALLAYPTLAAVDGEQSLLAQGILEVVPLLAPRTLFVWGPQRVLPVRVSELTIQEELFDATLTPLRATASLTLRVLSYSDLLPTNPDYATFQIYQQELQTLAQQGYTTQASAVTGVQIAAL